MDWILLGYFDPYPCLGFDLDYLDLELSYDLLAGDLKQAVDRDFSSNHALVIGFSFGGYHCDDRNYERVEDRCQKQPHFEAACFVVEVEDETWVTELCWRRHERSK